MSSNKKGEFDPLALIGKAVLVLLILVILMLILTRYFKVPIGLGKCSEYGKCVEKTIGCTANEVKLLVTTQGGCTESQVCCMTKETQTQQQQQLQDLTPVQQEAVTNAIILTLNNNPTPIADRETINLKEGTPYTFNVKINSKMNTPELNQQIWDDCIIYITDSREKDKIYYFNPQSPTGISTTPTNPDAASADPIIPALVGCKLDGSKLVGQNGEFKFTPSMLDTYRGLMLNIIMLRNPEGFTEQPGVQIPTLPEDYYSNTNNWFAFRTYRLNIEPVIKISGISGTWVAKDDMTISCTDVTCTKFGVKLIKLDPSATESTEQQMISKCTGPDTDFSYSLAYITGTSIQQTGIPLNLNIGGFRLPIGQQKVVYQTASKPIIVADNKATILIDKATMISTFYAKTSDESLFVGDTTYLCVRATKKDSDAPIYAVSKIPLKVDVLPPFIDQDAGITVVYPDRLNMTLTGTYGGKYYYKDYPKVRISGCYDFGQSGCANYDYYIHPGEFIQLNSITGDIGTGITALVLTEGLNMLMNALAAKDPLNTICPYIFSTDYRPNTNPEIRFPYRGQGIMCIRAADRVGNKELYWKALWLPDQMFQNIVAEATS